MSTGPKDGVSEAKLHTTPRGGARPNSGPKIKLYENTEEFRDELLVALKSKAEETGRTVAEELVDVAYSEDKRAKMPAIKLIYDKLIPETQKRVHEYRPLSTQSGLPERDPDPAKVVRLQ